MVRHLKFRYTIYKLLSTGILKPLFWWGVFCVLIILVLLGIAQIPQLDLNWIQIVGAFMDAGVFGGIDYNETGIQQQILLFFISIISLVCVSAMLVSMITNTFSNIVYKYHNGDFRRLLHNYILIIGSGESLPGILAQVSKEKKDIVIFAPKNPYIDGYEYYFYRGDKTCSKDLDSIGIEEAHAIYVLSDKSIANDDAKCLTCLDLLRHLSTSCSDKVHCYVIVNEFTTSEVFAYSQKNTTESSNLFLVDIINTSEYIAEHLMLNNDFLPIIHASDTSNAHIIIMGAGNLAQGLAYTIAHICHYPRLNGQLRKTRITLMDPHVQALKDRLLSSRSGLFELADRQDLLDIEWEFVALSPESEEGQLFLRENAQRNDSEIRYIICPDDDTLTMPYMLHLPRICYESPIAVHVTDTNSIVNRANMTRMYGQFIPFGFLNNLFDHDLLSYRSKMGKKVNFIYDQAYQAISSKNADEAWYKISESNKLSSIYCALAMPLRERCFDENDSMGKAEAEHRRWMTSMLLIGHSAADQTDRAHFLHQDIVPFEDLTEGEKEKDRLLLNATQYILSEQN